MRTKVFGGSIPPAPTISGYTRIPSSLILIPRFHPVIMNLTIYHPDTCQPTVAKPFTDMVAITRDLIEIAMHRDGDAWYDAYNERNMVANRLRAGALL